MADKTVSIWVNVKGNAKKALAGLNTSLKKTETQTKKTAIGFKSIATAVGGLVVLKKAADWMKESTRLALVQEKAEKRLLAVYGKNIDSLKKYASALQEKSTFGDEEILLAQSKLAVFVKEEEQLKALTQATVDFATITDMDLNSAMALVGKSVGSSTNALTRYGIEVKGAVGSTERISSAVENMSKLFEGAALAESLSDAGQLEQMENTIGDMRETVGEELVPAMLEWKKAQVEIFTFIADNAQGIGGALAGVSEIVRDTVLVSEFLIDAWNKLNNIAEESTHSQQRSDELKFHRDKLAEANKQIKANEKILEVAKAQQKRYAEGSASYETIGVAIDKANKLILHYKDNIILANKRIDQTVEAQDRTAKSLDKVTIKQNTYAEAVKDTNDEKVKGMSFAEKAILEEIRIQEQIAEMQEDARTKKVETDAQAIITAQEQRQTNMQTTIDIAQQTAQAVQNVMSAVNNRKQQDHDNEVQRQKDDVKNSSMSSKQKAIALEKIEKDASKKRMKIRLTEWRQAIIMSLVNTSLGVTRALATGGIPLAIATGVVGATSTGIIASNKPKAFNGMVLDNQSGMTGDVIPIMARKGEEVLSPSDPRNVKNGGGNTQSVSIGAPQITIQGNATAETAETIRGIMSDFGREVEEMFTNGKINANIVNEALAV